MHSHASLHFLLQIKTNLKLAKKQHEMTSFTSVSAIEQCEKKSGGGKTHQ
jgi:hypothetical protein